MTDQIDLAQEKEAWMRSNTFQEANKDARLLCLYMIVYKDASGDITFGTFLSASRFSEKQRACLSRFGINIGNSDSWWATANSDRDGRQ